MNDAREIVDLIGRDALASDLGVLTKTVSIAAAAGRFPASWYIVINAAAAKHGAQVPLGLFRFKRVEMARPAGEYANEVSP